MNELEITMRPITEAKWTDVVDLPFPVVEEVTDDMQKAAFKQSVLMRGSIRLILGRLETSAEISERYRRAMSLPLR